MERVTRPEGDAEIARFFQRIFAALIDGIVLAVLFFSVTVPLLGWFSPETLLAQTGINFVYYAVFNSAWGGGGTPGKRLMGLRVVARDGARLTGGAVLARNAMREIEVFLPLSFLAMQSSQGQADAFLVLFSLSWSCIFLFFPLFNRDRLRAGDLIAGTWVVRTVSSTLGDDLGAEVSRQRRTFSEAALGLYGVYELQTLEDVLRGGRDDAIATVAATIRRKADIPDDGDDYRFLSDYYAALCGRLERGLMVGQRRADKFGAARTG